MKKEKYSAFMANLAMLLALETYTVEKGLDDMDIMEDAVGAKEAVSEVDTQDVDRPKISSPVERLPWETCEEFLKARKENNTPILMGAYCAVLIEPLPGEEYNVRLAADALQGSVIGVGEVFSQNLSIGPYTKSRGYKDGASYSGVNIVQTEGGGVCKIASTLYNVSILSNLDIVERHNHSMPVNYVPYGQDATVAYGSKDFKLRNNTDGSILIWSQMIGNRLYVGFYGQNQAPKVKWQHRIKSKSDAPKYYKTNSQLRIGEEKLVIRGIDGAVVESSVIITHKNGKVEVRDLGTSHYNPMPYVIERNK